MKSTVNIPLSAPLKEWMDKQVAERGLNSAGDFLRELLEEAQARSVRDQIDANLVESLDSGESIHMTKGEWSRLRREARRRTAGSRKKS